MKILSSVFRAYCRCSFNVICRFFYESSLQKRNSLVQEGTVKNCLDKFSVKFTEGYTCFHVKKCFCPRKADSFTIGNRVFINKRTGSFMCEKCRITADWECYSNMLEKSPKNTLDEKLSNRNFVCYDISISVWNKIIEETESLKHLADGTCCSIFERFKLGPFLRSVINKLDIRINTEMDTLYFPLYQSECIVGYKTHHVNGEESVFPNFDCPGVLKSPTNSHLNACIVVGSVQDFLALSSVDTGGYEVVCLPYGGLYLPQSSLPFFERYEKIILWLGEKYLDETGKIAGKLIEKRCYVVRPTENQVSPCIALSSCKNIPEILSEAKLSFNEFVTTFSSLREGILAELQNPTQCFGVPWRRFPSLTQLLKGHRRGEMTILTGPTGVGKTTFLSEYSLDLASQGVHTLWGSFEIKNTKLARIMLTQFAQAPLPSSLSEYNELCDRFEKLPIFFLTFHGQQNIFNVMDAIHHCSYIYDIAHVIIDNVQFMIEVSSDVSNLDRFGKQDLMIQMLRSFASQNNCHVTLVMHPRKTENDDLAINSIFGGVKASQEADNILIIQKKDPVFYKRIKELEVVKNRFSGDVGSFTLNFFKPALSFAENKALDRHYSEHFSSENNSQPELKIDSYER